MADSSTSPYIRWFRDIGSDDVALVGGKNASLGELYRELRSAGVRVPDGFAVTADAYRALVESGGLRERIAILLQGIDGRDVRALAAAGAAIRELVEAAPWPSGLERVVGEAYAALGDGPIGASVAVRSSATAEDLPEASFAGQQETYLGVRGAGAVVEACRRCFASLFTDRAIAYRIDRGFDERNPAVLAMVADVIATAHACGRKIGICGQAPSDYPEFARFLVERGIDSISLNPDAVVRGLETIAAAEQRSLAGTAARAR